MKLTDIVSQLYGTQNFTSQNGEDAIIKHIFDVIGVKYEVCMEFGAADGFFCSNTANLWFNNGWHAILVEPKEKEFENLQKNTDSKKVDIFNEQVTSIDLYIKDEIDFLSVDIDGLEYQLIEKMQKHPRVVCVEHNPTFPPFVEFVGKEWQGSSAASLTKLMKSKGYTLVAVTKTNLIFVSSKEMDAFQEKIDTDLYSLFDWQGVSYVVTDYHGNYDIVGMLPYSMNGKPHLLTRIKMKEIYDQWLMDGAPLDHNGSPHESVKAYFIWNEIEKSGIKTFVETGSGVGQTIAAIRPFVDEVYSIEAHEGCYNTVVNRFADDPKINLYHGDSGKLLKEIIEKVDSAVVWLDAHYSGEGTALLDKETPIVEELKILGQYPEKTFHIIIDDARLFGTVEDYPTVEELEDLCKEVLPEHSFYLTADEIMVVPK